MKTICNEKEVLRVKDEVAAQKVKAGTHIYCPKKVWKNQRKINAFLEAAQHAIQPTGEKAALNGEGNTGG